MDLATEPDVAEIARARTMAGVCAALDIVSGLAWAAVTGALMKDDQFFSRPRSVLVSAVTFPAVTQVAAGIWLVSALRRRHRLVPAGLILGTIGSVALTAGWLVHLLYTGELRRTDLSIWALHSALVLLPLVSAGFSAYTLWRHGRLFRSGAGGAPPTAG